MGARDFHALLLKTTEMMVMPDTSRSDVCLNEVFGISAFHNIRQRTGGRTINASRHDPNFNSGTPLFIGAEIRHAGIIEGRP